jgi:hypothetical protein
MPNPLLVQKRPPIEFIASKHDRVRRPSIETPVGDIFFIGRNGKRTRITTSGLATDPEISPSGAIAFVEGQIISYEDKDQPMKSGSYQKFPTYFPKQVVVWRDGKIACRFTPGKLYTVKAKWVDETRIATSSQGSHGPVYLELWDARTGRRIEKRMSYEEKLPAWTKNLPT